MKVVLRGGTVLLEETDDFGSFAVRADPDVDADAALRCAGAGYVDGDARIAVGWLRAAGPGTQEWRQSLDGMLAYAASKGWLHGDHVQAHVERD